jgi:hypothetical protein
MSGSVKSDLRIVEIDQGKWDAGVGGNAIAGIPQCNNLIILGIEFQGICRFSLRVKNKLIKAMQ